MKSKNVILVALCSSVALLAIDALSYSGAFQDTANMLKFGYQEQNIGSAIMTVYTIPTIITTLFNGLFFASFAFFLWKIKSIMANKTMANLAITFWCSAAFVSLCISLFYSYVSIVYQGQDLVVNKMYLWHEEGISQYPLLYELLSGKLFVSHDFFLFSDSIIGLSQKILWTLAYITLISEFVTIKRVNKAIGFVGLLMMVILLSNNLFRFVYYLLDLVSLSFASSLFLFLGLMQRIGWVVTLVLILKEYNNNKFSLS